MNPGKHARFLCSLDCVRDNRRINQICKMIASGASLKTVAKLSGIEYTTIAGIAEGVLFKSIASKYNFPSHVNY